MKSEKHIKGRFRCSIADECPRKTCVLQLIFGYEASFIRKWQKCDLFKNRRYRVVKAPDNVQWQLQGRKWVAVRKNFLTSPLNVL